jgi:hypothetical protein
MANSTEVRIYFEFPGPVESVLSTVMLHEFNEGLVMSCQPSEEEKE